MNIDTLTNLCIGACISWFVGLAFLTVFTWLGGNPKSSLFAFVRKIYSALTREKYILIWIDDRGEEYGYKLCKELRKSGVEDLLRSLKSPRDLLNYPLSPKRVKTLILIVTDVTKLSGNNKLRELIQKRIINYVKKGGGLVGTHDLIYRRVRNTQLEKLFGCQINSFKGVDWPLKYIKNPDCTDSKLTENLPNEFELNDGEIIWGDKWQSDVHIIFNSTDEFESRPLVTARECHKGRVVWLNSGDTKDDIFPESIAKPEKEFLILLKNSIEWVSNANVN